MNAPLRKDAVTGSLAQPRVTFRVRQRTALSFDVHREMAGFDVVPVEEEALFGPFQGEEAANTFAYDAAERFHQHYPSFQVDVQPFPKLGRRPGQAYAERADECRQGPRDCLEPCLPAVGSFW